MPIKLYKATVVKSKLDEDSIADDELAKISAGEFDYEYDADEDQELEPEEESAITSEAEEESFLDEDDEYTESDENEDESNLANIYDLLTSFFKINSNPSDPQFHALAQSIGMEPDDLESLVYKVMSIMMEDTSSKKAVEDAINEAEEDTEDTDEDTEEDQDEDQETVESDVSPYSPAEAEDDGAPDLDTLPVESSANKRLRYSLSRR